MIKRVTTKIRRKHVNRGLLAIVLVVVAFSSYAVANRFFAKSKTKKTVSNTITYSTDHPDETKPDKVTYKWSGAPTDPKYITLSTIGAEGFLQNVGVDQKSEIAVPNNIHMAGWFNQTARPGESGLSIIDGHVTGRVNNGIFEKLVNIKAGDTFKVEFGDGSSKEFRVKKSVAVDTKDAAAVLFSQEPGIIKQLNIITCTGKWDTKANQYTQRLIVITEAV